MDTLRSTCQELKVKTSGLCSEDPCSTTTSSSLTSSNSQLGGGRSKKCKKSKKKKKSSGSQCNKISLESQQSDFVQDFLNEEKHESCHGLPETKAPNWFVSKRYCVKVICFNNTVPVLNTFCLNRPGILPVKLI